MATINNNPQIIGKIESALSKAIAELHFTLKVSARLNNPKIVQKLQKQHDQLIAIAQEITLIMDRVISEQATDQLFQVGDVVQVNKPFSSYHQWIGKVVLIDLKKRELIISFSGTEQPKIFGFNEVTKAWKTPVPRLMKGSSF